MNNLVSVIVICYNQEKLITACLKSIIKQSYKNLEILVVNDGSTDNSIAKMKAVTDNRIQLLNQENLGREQARLTGINNSTGDWIMFVDGDDMLCPNAIDLLVNEALKTNSDIVIGSFSRFYDQHGKLKRNVLSLPNLTIEHSDYISQYYPAFFGKHCTPASLRTASGPLWGKIYKTTIIKDNLPPLCNMAYREDEYWNLYFLYAAKRITVINDRVVLYRWGGIINSWSPQIIDNICKIHLLQQKRLHEINHSYLLPYETNLFLSDIFSRFFTSLTKGLLTKDQAIEQFRKLMTNPVVIQALEANTDTRKNDFFQAALALDYERMYASFNLNSPKLKLRKLAYKAVFCFFKLIQ